MIDTTLMTLAEMLGDSAARALDKAVARDDLIAADALLDLLRALEEIEIVFDPVRNAPPSRQV